MVMAHNKNLRLQNRKVGVKDVAVALVITDCTKILQFLSADHN